MRFPSHSRALGSVSVIALAGLAGCGHKATPTDVAPPSASGTAAVDAGHDATSDALADAVPPLAADLADRVRSAHARFGAAARVRTIGDTFVLVEAGPPGPLFDKATSLVERALPPLFDDRFTRHPQLGVTVYFFPTAAAYAAYYRERQMDAGSNLGVYRPWLREIAVDVSKGEDYLPTFTHEIVHPLMEADFRRAPYWLSEGIATLLEAPVFGKDGAIHGAPRNWRHEQLQDAFAHPVASDPARLDALFGMPANFWLGHSRDTAGQNPDDVKDFHYALARSVCAWLDGQGKLWPFYHAWRDGYADDPTGEKAFTRVMGMTPKAANAAWLRWAR